MLTGISIKPVIYSRKFNNNLICLNLSWLHLFFFLYFAQSSGCEFIEGVAKAALASTPILLDKRLFERKIEQKFKKEWKHSHGSNNLKYNYILKIDTRTKWIAWLEWFSKHFFMVLIRNEVKKSLFEQEDCICNSMGTWQ